MRYDEDTRSLVFRAAHYDVRSAVEERARSTLGYHLVLSCDIWARFGYYADKVPEERQLSRHLDLMVMYVTLSTVCGDNDKGIEMLTGLTLQLQPVNTGQIPARTYRDLIRQWLSDCGIHMNGHYASSKTTSAIGPANCRRCSTSMATLCSQCQLLMMASTMASQPATRCPPPSCICVSLANLRSLISSATAAGQLNRVYTAILTTLASTDYLTLK